MILIRLAKFLTAGFLAVVPFVDLELHHRYRVPGGFARIQLTVGVGDAVELGPTGLHREEPEISTEGGSLRAMARAG
jgi:hypothetical protein